MGSILAGFIMLVGPISSLLVNKFGPRKTCIAGAFLSAISIFVSTFSPNVYMLMVGQSDLYQHIYYNLSQYHSYTPVLHIILVNLVDKKHNMRY